jgi:hypothetical protein
LTRRSRPIRNQFPTKRSLIFEGLETRSLLAFVELFPFPENVQARNDSIVLKADSSENSLTVLDNDFGWWSNRWISSHANTSSPSSTSVAAGEGAGFVVTIRSDTDSEPTRIDLLPPTRQIQILSVTAPKHGTLRISDSKTSLVYTPDKGFEGVEQFEYTIDGVVPERSKALVNIHVVQPVLAVDDWYHFKTNDSVQKLQVTSNDRSNAANLDVNYFAPAHAVDLIDGLFVPQPVNRYKIVSIGTASHGGKLAISSDGSSIDYQPADNFEGLETFTYTSEDSHGYRDVGQVSVRVGSSEASSALAKQESIRQKWLELLLDRQQWHFGSASSDSFYPSPYDWHSPILVGSTRLTTDSQALASLSYEAGNNQIAGAGEGDIVETDGSYIYLLSRQSLKHELIVIDVRDQAKPTILTRFAVEGQLNAQHRLGDRLVLIASSSNWPEKSVTTVTTLDISDRASPKILRSSELAGDYKESRLINDKLYVFTHTVLALPAVEKVPNQPTGASFHETGRQFLERLGEQLYSSLRVTIVNRDGSGISSGEIAHIVDVETAVDIFADSWGSILTVSSFDVDATAVGPFDFDLIDTSGYANLFVTTDAIYVLESSWNRTTFQAEIGISSFSFGVTDGSVNPQATGAVDGYLQNRFSVGAFQGDLQIFTTGASNRLSVLRRNGSAWDTIGKIENIAPGEQIQAARFYGDRAFLVTFRQVDPLFVIDLADATKPTILGELKIPGYSQYLHLIDSTHLMGIGRDADEQTGLWGSLQVSLFDITHLSEPKLQSRFQYAGGRQTFSSLVESSTGLSNNQALGYFADSGILALPLHHREDWLSQINIGQGANIDPKLPEVEVLRMDPATGIEKLGEIQSPTRVERTLRIGNHLYVLATDRLIVTELTNPNTVIAELMIPAPTTTGGNSTDPNTESGGTVTKTDQEKEVREARKRFHNKTKPCDVDGDGTVGPVDVLNVINFLRATGTAKVSEMVAARSLTAQAADSGFSQQDLHWDVNEDGDITPLDVLVVINQLKREVASGEGEAASEPQVAGNTPSVAADMSDIEKRRSRNLG